MVAVVRAYREKRMRVVARRSPRKPLAAALSVEIGDEREYARVIRVDLKKREDGKRGVLHRRRRDIRRKQRLGAAPVACEGEGAGEAGARKERQVGRRVVEPQHAVLLRLSGERERMAGVGRHRVVRRHRPALQEAEDAVARESVERIAAIFGLDEEVRRIERHFAVPRRVAAVGPHHEVNRPHHRLDAPDARSHHVFPRRRDGGENPARADQREHARGSLLKAAVRIFREPP